MASIRMSVDVDFLGGTTVDEAITEALEFSRKNACFVDFSFNGIPMSVCALSGIGNREADIKFYKKIFYSMLESRSRKAQDGGDAGVSTDSEEKHSLDEPLTKLVKAMDLVDEAYKWFLDANWDKLATEDCIAIQRKIGQLISDINDTQRLREDE